MFKYNSGNEIKLYLLKINVTNMTHLQSIKFHEYQPGNENFRHYTERLKYCFIANNIVTDEARRANFFTVCGEQVYELVVALITPLQTYEVRYETIIDILGRQYTPTVL